ncbi:Soluble lytic murein transglycosylase precursor [Pelotomaculum schinkii]|uniref:Soluble lytic murein transglycosylase n=1 Tax=Pelotomaculum schinkii TaxID=78350 RepID=A0A4Y7RBQ6_9FIRM|nr:Soluble lytic murein transglycosylase precursor [Pelotomaculum schinkii]TEB13570.1 Soluble lytic murein transglycosylase precursor [Pelotomaculum sp. FP]
MSAVSRKRINKKKMQRRILLIFLLLLAILNFDSIVRFFNPLPYHDTITFYGKVYNVDPALIAAVIKAESNFNSKAVSVRGARGLMQIMPETGLWAASQTGESAFDSEFLFDPETNIKLGTWYLSDLGKEFDGSTVLILAAYNGGRGNVKDWLAGKTLINPEASISQIPFPETRHYVKKVLLYYRLYSYLYK